MEAHRVMQALVYLLLYHMTAVAPTDGGPPPSGVNSSLQSALERLLQESSMRCDLKIHSCDHVPKQWRGCSRMCSCDPSCTEYGDCCYDYAAAAQWSRSDRAHHSCLFINDARAVLMTSSCAPLHHDTHVEELCLQQVQPSNYSYILDLPVVSSASNKIYQNYYCALCNDDSNHLFVWNLTMKCTNMKIFSQKNIHERFSDMSEYFSGHSRWRVNTTNALGRQTTAMCKMQISEFRDWEIFHENYEARECLYPKGTCSSFSRRYLSHCEGEIRRCDTTWKDKETERLCGSYQMITFHGRKVYKNPHCALCNYVNMSSEDVQCSSKECIGRRLTTGKLPNAFSILMDFDSKSCSEDNEIYDPLKNRCYKLQCGKLYQLKNRQCIKMKKESRDYSMANSTLLLDDSCLKIAISEENFVGLDDGSIFINSSGRFYDLGEYEIYNDSNLLVCNQRLEFLSMVTERHRWTTLVVLTLSLLCLFLHILFYFLLPKLRNLPSKILVSLSTSLFIAHFLFLVESYAVPIRKLCMVIGVTLHFFYLSSFCWMNVMSFDVFTTFRGSVHRAPEKNGKTYKIYSLYCFTVPLFIVGPSIAIEFSNLLPDEFKPKYAGKTCWIESRNSLLLFFVLPSGIIFLENIIFFIFTSYGIYKQSLASKFAMKRSQSAKEHRIKAPSSKSKGGTAGAHRDHQRFILYVKLAVIQGLTWTTGFTAIITGLSVSWYIFTVLNGLQGVFIFVFFDLKKTVIRSVQDKWKNGGVFFGSQGTRRTTITNTTSSFGGKGTSKSSCSSQLGSNSSIVSVLETDGSRFINWVKVKFHSKIFTGSLNDDHEE